MIVVLCGKSCSGKDSIGRELRKLGYKQILSTTTRPMRDNETDGVEYEFTSLFDFMERKDNGEFLETRKYYPSLIKEKNTVWWYGSVLSRYREAEKDTENKYYAILTPDALEKLKGSCIEHESFYIKVSDETIKARQIIRGDDKCEAERRFQADKIDFQNIENQVDHVIKNDGNMTPLITAILIDVLSERENIE